MSQVNPFKGNTPGLETPATNAVAITPNDSTDVPIMHRAIYVGVEGDVVIQDQSGTQVTFKSVQGVLPIRPKRVLATGTTATDIIGLY